MINTMKFKSRDDVFIKVSQYTVLAEQCETKIKNLTLDNGSKFINDTMVPICLENRVAERGNRIDIAKARAIMIEANYLCVFGRTVLTFWCAETGPFDKGRTDKVR